MIIDSRNKKAWEIVVSLAGTSKIWPVVPERDNDKAIDDAIKLAFKIADKFIAKELDEETPNDDMYKSIMRKDDDGSEDIRKAVENQLDKTFHMEKCDSCTYGAKCPLRGHLNKDDREKCSFYIEHMITREYE